MAIRILGLVMALCLGVSGFAHAETKPIPVKVVVLATFEIGEVTGDRPGEFQPWVEGLPLKETIQVPEIGRAHV